MKVIDQKDVKLRKKGKNDYKNLWKELKPIIEKKKGEGWIVELEEDEIYKLLGSKGRNHISSKYGLSQEIGKQLTTISKMKVYCNFTQSEMVYYISNESLK